MSVCVSGTASSHCRQCGASLDASETSIDIWRQHFSSQAETSLKLPHLLVYISDTGYNWVSSYLIQLKTRVTLKNYHEITFYSFVARLKKQGNCCFWNLQFWTVLRLTKLTSTSTRVDLYASIFARPIGNSLVIKVLHELWYSAYKTHVYQPCLTWQNTISPSEFVTLP